MLLVLFGALDLALVDCALHVFYVPNATSMVWTLLLPWQLLWPGLCDLHYETASACL
jgi:hypothetical protein